MVVVVGSLQDKVAFPNPMVAFFKKDQTIKI